jgi:hypothetical protein
MAETVAVAMAVMTTAVTATATAAGTAMVGPRAHRLAAMASAIDSEDDDGARWVPDAQKRVPWHPFFIDVR